MYNPCIILAMRIKIIHGLYMGNTGVTPGRTGTGPRATHVFAVNAITNRDFLI